eukprot:gene8708-9594_t
MSLGWQTESALLPSKAKPIKVGDRSLLSLKAIVFEKEQQRHTQGAQDGETRLKAIRKAAVASKEKESHTSSTKSTKSREVTDEEALREQRAAAALAAKAQLYEDILAGKVQGEASLIDFGSKRKLDRREEGSVSATKEVEQGARKAAKVVQDYGPQQWQWSRGDAATHEVEGDSHDPDAVVAEWRASQQAEKAFKLEAERRLQDLPVSLSKAARVQTQWEKTLQSSAREYIKEVHQEVVDERNGSGTHPLDRRRDRLLVLQARRKEAQQAEPHSQSYHSNTSS